MQPWVTVFVAVIVGLFSSVITGFINNQISKRQIEIEKERIKLESEKNFKELIVKFSFEHWKEMANIAMKAGHPFVWPLSAYILTNVKKFDLAFQENFDNEKIIEKLNELDEFEQLLDDYLKKRKSKKVEARSK